MAAVDGIGIAERLIVRLAALPVPQQMLAVVMIGGDAASRAFVARKRAVADRLGVRFSVHNVPQGATQKEVESLLRGLSLNVSVGGIVLQLPVPATFDRDALIAHISPEKDIDDLTGKSPYRSPAVQCVKEVLATEGCAIRDFRDIVVIGQGFLVGLPVAAWLGTIGVPYSGIGIDTPDPDSFVRRADLIITGVGKTGVVRAEALKEGAVVIDFGFPPDIDQHELALAGERLRLYTPTPGGTGPILVAKLFENFFAVSG